MNMEGIMEGIARYDVNEEWAHSGMIRAGDFCFLNYCAGNVGGTVEEQINGAFERWNVAWLWLGLRWKTWFRWTACSAMYGISR